MQHLKCNSMMMNLYNWEQCPISIFIKFREKFNDEKYTEFKVYSVSKNETHIDAFASICKSIFYDAYLCEQFDLTEEECFACIVHEIGHIFDSTPSIDNKPSEERELNADKKVLELGLQDSLVSALGKMCPEDELARKRVHALSECRYNAIYVIESFGKNKWANEFLAYGCNLCDEINSFILSYKISNIKCNYYSLDDKEQWNKCWSEVEDRCKKGERPILQFICHGEVDGLKIVNEIIPWNEVLGLFSKINKITQNLYVTMNVCYSASICNSLMQINRDNPFIGCICAQGTICMADPPSEPRFLSFYKSLMAGFTMEGAINAFREEIKQEQGKARENQWVILSKNMDSKSYNIEHLNHKERTHRN